MTGVDTNILVRLLTRDNEGQFQKAFALFNKDTVFIADTVMLETEWVLRFAYSFKSHEIRDAFIKLLSLPNVKTKKNPTSRFCPLNGPAKASISPMPSIWHAARTQTSSLPLTLISSTVPRG